MSGADVAAKQEELKRKKQQFWDGFVSKIKTRYSASPSDQRKALENAYIDRSAPEIEVNNITNIKEDFFEPDSKLGVVGKEFERIHKEENAAALGEIRALRAEIAALGTGAGASKPPEAPAGASFEGGAAAPTAAPSAATPTAGSSSSGKKKLTAESSERDGLQLKLPGSDRHGYSVVDFLIRGAWAFQFLGAMIAGPIQSLSALSLGLVALPSSIGMGVAAASLYAVGKVLSKAGMSDQNLVSRNINNAKNFCAKSSVDLAKTFVTEAILNPIPNFTTDAINMLPLTAGIFYMPAAGFVVDKPDMAKVLGLDKKMGLPASLAEKWNYEFYQSVDSNWVAWYRTLARLPHGPTSVPSQQEKALLDRMKTLPVKRATDSSNKLNNLLAKLDRVLDSLKRADPADKSALEKERDSLIKEIKTVSKKLEKDLDLATSIARRQNPPQTLKELAPTLAQAYFNLGAAKEYIKFAESGKSGRINDYMDAKYKVLDLLNSKRNIDFVQPSNANYDASQAPEAIRIMTLEQLHTKVDELWQQIARTSNSTTKQDLQKELEQHRDAMQSMLKDGAILKGKGQAGVDYWLELNQTLTFAAAALSNDSDAQDALKRLATTREGLLREIDVNSKIDRLDTLNQEMQQASNMFATVSKSAKAEWDGRIEAIKINIKEAQDDLQKAVDDENQYVRANPTEASILTAEKNAEIDKIKAQTEVLLAKEAERVPLDSIKVTAEAKTPEVDSDAVELDSRGRAGSTATVAMPSTPASAPVLPASAPVLPAREVSAAGPQQMQAEAGVVTPAQEQKQSLSQRILSVMPTREGLSSRLSNVRSPVAMLHRYRQQQAIARANARASSALEASMRDNTSPDQRTSRRLSS